MNAYMVATIKGWNISDFHCTDQGNEIEGWEYGSVY